ncbi:hypothetical protein VI03_18105 [Burkholderia vietnamiensis]|nr:hypothetical protein VI03_18105 [Burkholderia vietnamiensis]
MAYPRTNKRYQRLPPTPPPRQAQRNAEQHATPAHHHPSQTHPRHLEAAPSRHHNHSQHPAQSGTPARHYRRHQTPRLRRR